MSTNGSPTLSDSTLQSNLTVISTELLFSICFIQRPSSLVYLGSFIARILPILPLCTLVLCIGHKRKQQKRTNSMTAMMSHSDCFIYHLMVMELIGVLGLVLCCFSYFPLNVKTYFAGLCIHSVAWYGELFFHVLTCVERFLAVVHPITYVSLKSERGIKIRNVCIVFVWLFSVGETGLQTSNYIVSRLDGFLLTLALVISSLCSLSTLCVLIRPRPGEKGADAERVDQSKKRAFFTIIIILGALLLKCVWNLIWTFLQLLSPNQCIIMSLGVWMNIPSTVVLPLLFLQRAGLLGCCRNVK